MEKQHIDLQNLFLIKTKTKPNYPLILYDNLCSTDYKKIRFKLFIIKTQIFVIFGLKNIKKYILYRPLKLIPNQNQTKLKLVFEFQSTLSNIIEVKN
jgi:hypothetical protein